MDAQTAAALRQALAARDAQIAMLQKGLADLAQKISATNPGSELAGRPVFHHLVGSQTFDATNAGKRASPIALTISQDGPFFATHYPVVMWKPSLPTSATNFGKWRPVYHGPLAQQYLASDVVSISWEMLDTGSSRNFQTNPVPPFISTIDQDKLLPRTTMFAPNTTIQFIPTYEAVEFTGSVSTPTTGGVLVVAIPGFKIVTM